MPAAAAAAAGAGAHGEDEVLRVFIAIAAPESVRARAIEVISRLSAAPSTFRWSAERSIHLTLRFLGETRRSQLPGVEALMRRACAAIAPFDMSVDGAGFFGALEPVGPRVLWLGVHEGAAPLAALANALGFNEARAFAPHITIGERRADAAMSPAFLAGLRAELARPAARLGCTVDTITLYASKRGVFEPLLELPLRGRE